MDQPTFLSGTFRKADIYTVISIEDKQKQNRRKPTVSTLRFWMYISAEREYLFDWVIKLNAASQADSGMSSSPVQGFLCNHED